MITFTCQGEAFTLNKGQHYGCPREAGFRDTNASDLCALVDEIIQGRPWRKAVTDRYAIEQPWLYRIVTDSLRTAFFESVLPQNINGPVLDIGSGWGQTARPLASLYPSVVSLEPVSERMAFIRATAVQEKINDHLTFIEADYFDLEFSTRFALICAIGVLEWAGAFQGGAEPRQLQLDFLRRTRRDLAPGGSLVLGIENRLGLKYLLGCPDDHLGVPQVASLPAESAIRKRRETANSELRCFTYSQLELAQLLRAAGYTKIEFWAAFPDYKLPTLILPLGDGGKGLNNWLKSNLLPLEHNGYNGTQLPDTFNVTLRETYGRLANAGSAHHFVPSFFVRAS